jgi:galactokinase
MELFVPGRVCLFGEHSDWAGAYRRYNPQIERGYTLIAGTDQGVYARVDRAIHALHLTAALPDNRQLGPIAFDLDPAKLLEIARQGGFWSYIAGVAYQAVTMFHVGGLVIDNYFTDLPVQKGLSSSAAICVLVARAFNQLYHLNLTTRGEMELAYLGERTTPSRCGRMDQGCAYGRNPLLMVFDGDELQTSTVHPGGEFHLVVADLHARKDTTLILSRLNAAFPEAGNEHARQVQDLLGPHNRHIVHAAVDALQKGDASGLGALMVEAQALFDRYAVAACPEELTAPVLHRTLGYPPVQAHIFGGKGVGSQGDGSVQFLARSASDQQAVIRILHDELGMTAFPLTIQPGVADQ